MGGVARRMGTSIKGSIAMVFGTAKVVVATKTETGTREPSRMARKRASGRSVGRVEGSTRGNGRRTNQRAKANCYIETAMYEGERAFQFPEGYFLASKEE